MADRGKRPKKRPKRTLEDVPPLRSTDDIAPTFCLRHTISGYDVPSLSQAQRADLALALHKRAQMKWREITTAPRHGLGMEWMPATSIRPSGQAPEHLQADRYMVLRYSGQLPMVGVRTNETFHVLWIESDFGQVYDH